MLPTQKQGLQYFIVYRETVWLEISGVVVSSKSFLSSEFALKSYCKSQKGSRKSWPGKMTPVFFSTLQGINISHLGKRKIIFKSEFWWDMLVPWRVNFRGGNQLTLHKNFPIVAEEKKHHKNSTSVDRSKLRFLESTNLSYGLLTSIFRDAVDGSEILYPRW